MNKIIIAICFSLLLISCKKEDKGIAIPVETNSIIGKWKLIETSTYGVFGQGPWQTVAEANRAVIEIKTDSSFSFDNNFQWKAEHYDHVKRVVYNDGSYLQIYSSTPYSDGQWHPGSGITVVNNNQIILSRHSVDTGDDEKYVRL